MATITRLGPLAHLRAEPNQFVLHYRNGTIKRQGAGLAYWFLPLDAALAQVPVEDCATTFVLNERTADFQAVSAQITLVYRIADAARAASRVNFSIDLGKGEWLDRPLDRLATWWSQRALVPARSYLSRTPLESALRDGGEIVRRDIVSAIESDAEIAAMGLKLVGVVIDKLAPSAEVEKALQTPTREAIQAKADEATFQRRAQAVEKERAIKENELATQIELERQQERLIAKRGENAVLQQEQANQAELARVQAEAARLAIVAGAEAEAARTRARAVLDEQRERLAMLRDAPNAVLLSQALEQFAGKLTHIGHLNITPDLLAQNLTQFLRERGDAGPG